MTWNTLIEQAKKYPITSLYKGQLKQSGKALIGHCPFHEDKNSSFALYPETNTFNCFAGCGWGDSVAYYMKLNKVDFKTAVKALGK